jgi:4-hydroxy-4-methyl-2-oxoglutarate aldolase
MTYKTLPHLLSATLFATLLLTPAFVAAQPLSLTHDEMIQYTPMWKGERFPDGRPKVSDDVIQRMKHVTITEAWAALQRPDPSPEGAGGPGGMFGRAQGYINQYVGSMKSMNDEVICGRAMTAHFMPYRPDVNSAIQAQGRRDGRDSGQYTWGIDQLQTGDVYVANVCEAILDASHVGDNLGTAIWTKSGNGAVIYGTLRDLEGNETIDGFNVFVRDFRPQSNSNNMMIGINCPLQLGYVTVMPGDIVLAKRMGIVFIPAHRAEELVIDSERTRLRDQFAHAGVVEGRFTARQADGAFTPEMNAEFTQWLKDNKNNMGRFFRDPKAAPSPEFIEAYIKERESGGRR